MREQTQQAGRLTIDMGWRYAYWILLGCWIVGAGLTMANIRAGFFSSYLSDVTFPPWFYIVVRERVPKKRPIKLIRWFGRSPGRAASAIFLVGVVSELGQRYGIPNGTYDPWDIAAYAVGLLIAYGIDKFSAMDLGGV